MQELSHSVSVDLLLIPADATLSHHCFSHSVHIGGVGVRVEWIHAKSICS